MFVLRPIKDFILGKKLNVKIKYFLFCFILFFISILSFFSEEVKFYYFKWSFVSTPIGLIFGIFGNNSELNYYIEYLLTQGPMILNSSLQISLSLSCVILSIILLRIIMIRRKIK